MAETIKVRAGEYLIREGDESNGLFWLQKGQMTVYKTRGKEEVEIGLVFTGELVGEMSFLDEKPRCASVKAKINCELLEIQADNFKFIFEDQPKWFQVLIKTLVERLRRANAKIKI